MSEYNKKYTIKRLFCASCGREKSVLNLFSGIWVCTSCYARLQKKRDKIYYQKLRGGLK